jgi:hypothetical protein
VVPPGGFIHLPADAAVLGHAPADAEVYRREWAGDWCADCAAAPVEACTDHLDDPDQADSYGGLSRHLQRDGVS